MRDGRWRNVSIICLSHGSPCQDDPPQSPYTLPSILLLHSPSPGWTFRRHPVSVSCWTNCITTRIIGNLEMMAFINHSIGMITKTKWKRLNSSRWIITFAISHRHKLLYHIRTRPTRSSRRYLSRMIGSVRSIRIISQQNKN